MSADPADDYQQLQNEAWVGDAVLALWARCWLLRERGRIDSAAFTRLTGNDFLAGFGPPTEIEARIGRIYLRDGLAAAVTEIETQLLPVFRRQEARRARHG